LLHWEKSGQTVPFGISPDLGEILPWPSQKFEYQACH
jgi:hypothetical protein